MGSGIGLGILLSEGIGDTIRVSLAAEPKEELPVCWDILASLNLRQRGPPIVACPTCGRIEIELIPPANQGEAHFQTLGKAITVAALGCVVNGPRRATLAHLGLARAHARGRRAPRGGRQGDGGNGEGRSLQRRCAGWRSRRRDPDPGDPVEPIGALAA